MEYYGQNTMQSCVPNSSCRLRRSWFPLPKSQTAIPPGFLNAQPMVLFCAPNAINSTSAPISKGMSVLCPVIASYIRNDRSRVERLTSVVSTWRPSGRMRTSTYRGSSKEYPMGKVRPRPCRRWSSSLHSQARKCKGHLSSDERSRRKSFEFHACAARAIK